MAVYASTRMWNASDPYTCPESEANASYIFAYFKARGWSDVACAGLVGNTTHESYNNPAFHEVGGGGFGIVQWTPASNYTRWAAPRGFPTGTDTNDPELYLRGQCDRIAFEVANRLEFFGNSRYGHSWTYIDTWDAYIHNTTLTPQEAAWCFMSNYERPAYGAAMASLSKRQEYAQLWYDKFTAAQSEQQVRTAHLAAQWAVEIANDASHGYDQTYRWGERGDYDCSALVISAYDQFDMGLKAAGATYTGDMRSVMLAKGFEDVTSQINLSTGYGLIEGDVLLNTAHHTAIALGDGNMVQASINEHGSTRNGTPGDQTGSEIAVRTYYNYPWNYVLRYNGYSGFGTVNSSNPVSILRAVPVTKTNWATVPDRNG